MKKTNKIQILFIILLGLLFMRDHVDAESLSCDHDGHSGENAALQKSAGLNDKAVGVLDKGELAVNTGNFGELANFLAFFTNAGHWPRSANSNRQYYFGLGLLVGINDTNVIETSTQFMTKLQDWVPTDNALGREFSGEIRAASDDTPFMASSDFPTTWPQGRYLNGIWEASEERLWPGPWRIDTAHPEYPVVKEQIPGEFTSDRDIYCSYNDARNPKGSAGITIEQTAYSYGRPYAEDFIFFHIRIRNTSAQDHDSIYVGLYSRFRPDFDNHDYLNFIDSDNDGKKDFLRIYDVNNQANMNWQISEDRDPLAVVGMKIYETPYNMGITDFHHFSNNIKPTTDEGFWAIMSSDRDSGVFDSLQYYFHGDNRRIDDTSEENRGRYYPARYLEDADAMIEGGQINTISAVGPFELPADSSVVLSLALIMGDGGTTPDQPDFTDLMNNLAMADLMASSAYQGPTPPPAPQVTAVAYNTSVGLYWSADPSEKTEDAFLRVNDFEGYKIFRSEDKGSTWGAKISDSEGNFIGWEPVAIIDIDNDISGIDPVGGMHLGENSGLQHSYLDEGLVNGLEYWYCVTAYDRGDPQAEPVLASFMYPIGSSTYESHTVSAIPGIKASDYRPAAIDDSPLQPDRGSSDATVRVEMIDSDAVTGQAYRITFTDSNPVTFYLINTDSGDTLLAGENISDESGDNIPLTDGFRLVIINGSQAPLSSAVEYVFTTEKAVSGISLEDPFTDIRVVPDPYILGNNYETSEYGKKLKFNHLPGRCSIRIFTLAGDLVDRLEHNSELGYTFWDMRTKNDQFLAPGIYLYHVKSPDGHEKAGRFTVIR